MSDKITLTALREFILNSELPSAMPIRIVAIDGCAGSGKSTLALKLSRILDSCPIFQTDNFASWENPFGWYSEMIDQVLDPLRRSEAIRYKKRDWSSRDFNLEAVINPQPVTILEGVSSSRKEFREYLSFSIFISASKDVRLKRGLLRDGIEAKEKWLNWMIAEELYLMEHEPEKFADFVIDGESENANGAYILFEPNKI